MAKDQEITAARLIGATVKNDEATAFHFDLGEGRTLVVKLTEGIDVDDYDELDPADLGTAGLCSVAVPKIA